MPFNKKKLSKKGSKVASKPSQSNSTSIDQYKDMQEWVELGTPPPIIQGLYKLGFMNPTPIQKMAIPPAINEGADIIGAAETGSGKTLAFSIPILHHILKVRPPLTSASEPHPPLTSASKTHLPLTSVDEPHPALTTAGDSAKLEKKLKKPKLNVIDLNEVVHTYSSEYIFETEDKESGNQDGRVTKDGRVAGGSEVAEESEDEGDGQAEGSGSDVGDSVSSENNGDKLVFEVDSESANESLSDDDEDDSEDESDSSPLVVEPVLPRQRKRKMSAYRQMKEAARAKKERGFVGVRNRIPEEEFQLMLKGKADVWRSQSPPPMDQSTSSIADLPTETGIDHVTGSGCGLVALILTPTRELAMQVHAHISSVSRFTGIKVCTVVGGMATEKQERLLKQRPQIVVATPGRLWKLMSDGDPHLCNHDDLRFLVLDEADRMVEYGHYRELGNILDRLNGARVRGQYKVKGRDRQTLVFSATLAIPRRSTERKKKKKSTSSQETIDNLISRVGLKDDAKIVDLTGSKITVRTLTETKITCTAEEKDLHLYHFLLLHPGRTIVFVNSIDCLQRLRALLELLEMKPLPLHAHMQQRQRLKNLDRFTSSKSGVLVASDVAARGLDLPAVEHIVHYQVPRNSEVYVHRSGRTARGQREGLSVMLVGPEDLKAYRNICRTLNRDDVPNFPLDHTHIQSLRKRVSLAKQVHIIEYRRDKSRRAEKWMTQTADSLGMDLDDGTLKDKWSKKEERKLQELRGQFQELLRAVVVPRGMSLKFPMANRDPGAGIVLEHEKAILLAKKRQNIET
ncbi:ATP-dependent RNA helicase DDX24-like [Halichondria panicea]|uniref:ATP-dependent RNA helicase DDX24-like n=1 Tax=Halichondria panicea TaxID=6063 RepID=UPI00312B76D9